MTARTPLLHEILAVEKTRNGQLDQLIKDTNNKFNKPEYFQGHYTKLSMLEDTPQNKAMEAAAIQQKALPTTVSETLSYLLDFWAQAEDVQLQKNATNQQAKADICFRGNIIASGLPVDELLGLESRLASLRTTLAQIPTLNASVRYVPDVDSGRPGAWRGESTTKTIKTEKTTRAVVLYEATDKHPAQIKEVPQDTTVGTFEKLDFSGCATSAQKAEILAVVDDLLAEAKQARMRANTTPVVDVRIGRVIADLLLQPLR